MNSVVLSSSSILFFLLILIGMSRHIRSILPWIPVVKRILAMFSNGEFIVLQNKYFFVIP